MGLSHITRHSFTKAVFSFSGTTMGQHCSDGQDFSTGRLSSTSSTSSCSSEYSGEVIPHGPGKCHLSWLKCHLSWLVGALPGGAPASAVG